MRLVIFDIDGTLTQTMKADVKCFLRSLAEVCGLRDVDTDWSRYKHATDAGVFHKIYAARTGRSPLPMEVSQFRRHFVGLLGRASSEAPFAAVSGASQLLSRLADSSTLRVAPLPPGLGATQLASRWPVRVCATTIIRRHRAMMLWIENPSSDCPCKGPPSSMAGWAVLFTLVTVFGMLAPVVALAFRLLESRQMAGPRVWPQKVQFECLLTLATRIYS